VQLGKNFGPAPDEWPGADQIEPGFQVRVAGPVDALVFPTAQPRKMAMSANVYWLLAGPPSG